MAADNWDECPWDARTVRERVAGLVKSLIQARWKVSPGFLSGEQLQAWFPPDGGEALADRHTVRTHLGFARRDLRELQRLGVLPQGERSSASLITGPEQAGQLVGVLEKFLEGDSNSLDPVADLCRALAGSAAESPHWVGLVDWSQLPRLRAVLDQFPGDRPHWDSRAGRLEFRGRVVRTVARQAVGQRRVLDAFEELGWPDWMDAPFPETSDKLGHALKRLNKTLNGLRFEKSADNQRVGWRPCPASKRSSGATRKRTSGRGKRPS